MEVPAEPLRRSGRGGAWSEAFPPRSLVQGGQRSSQGYDVGDQLRRLWICLGQGPKDLKHAQTLQLVGWKVPGGASIEEVSHGREDPGRAGHLVRPGKELQGQPGQISRLAAAPLEDVAEGSSLTGRGGHALAVQRIEVADCVTHGHEPLREPLEALEVATNGSWELEGNRVSHQLSRAHQFVPDRPCQ